jgi:hypothetical protein
MELTPEDLLRLNVLLANQIQAIRIDESKMILYGLSERGDAKIQLHPNCRDDRYLQIVREAIADHIKEASGVYPAYIGYWHQMEPDYDKLAQWLMFGEPEAVLSVVHTPSLTVELARRAWWAMPNTGNALCLLEQKAILQSEFAKELAQYLLELLPFEEDHNNLIESVHRILKAGVIEEETRMKMWNRGRTKSAYWVGFLKAQPDNLPEPLPQRVDAEQIQTALAPLVAQNNQIAKQLIRITSSAGQTFLNTCEQVLRKPSTQGVVNSLFEIIADYFSDIHPTTFDDKMEMPSLITLVNSLDDSPEQQSVLTAMPAMKKTIRAMFLLSGLGDSVLRPIFLKTTAIGSLMRQKLKPITDQIFEELAILQKK